MTPTTFSRIKGGILRALPYVLLAILPLVYFWRALSDAPFLFFGGQMVKEHFPTLLHILHAVLEGKYRSFLAGLDAPRLWFCLQYGGFYPPNALLLPWVEPGVDGLFRAMFLLHLLHYTGAGLGAYALGRKLLGLRREGAFLVAVLYAFAGMRVTIPVFWTVTQALAWLPLFLLCLHRGLTDRQILPLAGAWLCLLAIFLAGSPAALLLALLLALPVAAWTTTPDSSLAIAGRAAVLILSGLAIPTLFLLLSLGDAEINSSSLDFSRFATTAGPLRPSWLMFLFAPFPARDITGWWDQIIYLGVLPLLFCPLALLRPLRLYGLPLLFIVGGLALAYGPQAPLLHLAHLLPGPRGVPTGHVYWSGAFRLLISLGVSLLAGLGLDTFLQPQPPGHRRWFTGYGRCLAGLFIVISTGTGMAAFHFVLLSGAEGRWGMAAILNCAVWVGIQLAVFLMAYQRRILSGSRGLAVLLLLLVVVDVFSFWSFFHPANFGYGPSYDLPPPSTVFAP
jgi:CRISPR-associated Cas5-like protein